MKDREYKRVMAFVKDGIRSGEFQVGSKLPTEREMAETLGMSRPSIREALKSMENIGLIESQQGSGNYICADANKTIFQILTVMLALGSITQKDVCEFRRAMEKTVCMLLLEKGISEDADKEMKSLLDNMKNDQSVRSDREFHALLVTAAHNELLSTIMGAVMTVYQEWIDLAMARSVGSLLPTVRALFWIMPNI